MSESAKSEKKAKKEKKHAQKQRPLKLFPANKKGKHVMHFMNLFRCIMYPFNAFFYPYKMYGNTKIGKGAYIYVGNHFCMWDILYPARTTWEGIHFLAKQSLTSAPVLRVWARRIGAITAVRDGSDVRALMDAMRCLKNGEKVSLFPEGTRNKKSEEEFLPFHGGSAMMAIKTKTPIIPFVVVNRPKLFHRTHVVFGDAFELSEFYDRKLEAEDYEAAEQIIKNRLYEIRDEFRALRRAKREKKK